MNRAFAIAVLVTCACASLPPSGVAAEQATVAGASSAGLQPPIGSGDAIEIGSKAFTESVVLGQIATLLARDAGHPASFTELGGTRILWSALVDGEIDVYAEYTGTIREEIFAGESVASAAAMRARVSELGLRMTEALGFNNTYALAMDEERAAALGITRISDLAAHPDLRLGFTSEFMDRGDGWPSLQRRYDLPQADVRGLEHALAYRALEGGSLDVIDVYSTDPAIRRYDLRLLDDDLAHFPRYDALFVYRADLAERAPDLVEALHRLEGRIDGPTMTAMNERAELPHVGEARVAADFLEEAFGIRVAIDEESWLDRLARTTRAHLLLVAISLLAAIVVAVPGGVLAAKRPVLGQFVVGTAEIVQTVPGLALLILLSVGLRYASLPTIGELPVILALFLYSLLPILRNTVAGMSTLPRGLRESAEVLGLSPRARLLRVELPMASPLILAGIKTTAVINVGYAALGGLIGAGGYGQPIMTGLRLNNEMLMLEGAVPAAAMALLVKFLFEGIERFLVPRGLRLQASTVS